MFKLYGKNWPEGTSKTHEEWEAIRTEWEKNHPIQLWFQNLYYSIYRICDNYLNPMNYYREIKYFIQRGIRGWSDRDCWSLSHYNSKVCKEMLDHMIKNLHGYPCILDGDDNYDKNFDKWKEILNKMRDSFETARKISNGDLEEYGECTFRLENLNFKKEMEEKYGCIYQTKDEHEKMKEGLELFVKYYSSLWD